jgi:sterol desaturase/sphingolipid hydroxylase (fatty acid hydroxylase superfamily)
MDDEFVKHVSDGFTIFGIGNLVLLVFCVLAELFMRWQEGKPVFHRESATNFSLLFVPFVIEALVVNAILLGGLSFVFHLTPLRIAVTPWTLPLYFIAGDFAFYLMHSTSHKIRIGWADHSIHHSAETFDFTVNLRLTPFESIWRLLAWTPIVAVGFDPVVLLLFGISGSAFQMFCHTERIGRLAPWFEWFFVTPHNHAVHHASNPLYIDKNYGGLTMFWDHVFGTYQRLEDGTPPVYGITRPVRSANPLVVVAFEFRHLIRDFAGAPTIGQKLEVLFGQPGKTFELESSHREMAASGIIETTEAVR